MTIIVSDSVCCKDALLRTAKQSLDDAPSEMGKGKLSLIKDFVNDVPGVSKPSPPGGLPKTLVLTG